MNWLSLPYDALAAALGGPWAARALLTSIGVAVPCALVGCILYLRRLSLLVDALAHVALPGIIVGFLLVGELHPLALLAGAAMTGLLAAAAIDRLAAVDGVRSDAAVGIVFTAMFAAGVIALNTVVRDVHLDTRCLLFGDVLGVSDASIQLLAVLAPTVSLAVVATRRWWALAAFDPAAAVTLGVPVAVVHQSTMAAASVTSVASFEAAGAILVIALFVLPAATAHLFTRHVGSMLAVATGFGVGASIAGTLLALRYDLSPTGTIVLVGTSLYALALLLAPEHGWLARRVRTAPRRAGAQPT